MAVQLTHQRLSNGLQSLSDASPDYELAPVGIASMHDQAQKLAEAGRNGDIYVIHAAEGETVIPMEVLAANPQIKQLLFAQMEDMGLDPQEFVVGNELNSINPVTGLPEFFFKSLFRSVKKAVKKVFKFAKKIAPIALPIALSYFGLPAGVFGETLAGMFGPGMASTAALGGGIGGFLGGGGLKGAFKGAILSGGIATLGAGLTEGIRGTEGTFGSRFMEGAGKTWGGELVNPISTGISDTEKILLDTMGLGDKSIESTYLSPSTSVVHDPLPRAGWGVDRTLISTAAEKGSSVGQQALATQAAKDTLNAQTTSGLTDWFTGGPTVDASDVLAHHAGDAVKLKALHNLPSGVLQTALENVNPGPIAKYAPMALAGGAAAYQGGMFDEPEAGKEEAERKDLAGFVPAGPTGAELVELDPDRYKIPVNPFEFQPSTDPFVPPTLFAADGGMINGPGTGTSDSIPGWLSDGEFVVTERGVRGADPTGQGRREAGAANLYNIMRNFEMRA